MQTRQTGVQQTAIGTWKFNLFTRIKLYRIGLSMRMAMDRLLGILNGIIVRCNASSIRLFTSCTLAFSDVRR